MTRLHPCTTLSAFALVVAAAAARAGETPSPAPGQRALSSPSLNASAIASWKFQAGEQDGKPCLCIQAGPDNQATCEEMTFRVESVGCVSLKAEARQVRVRGGGVEACADRVTRTGKAGATLEMLGKVRLKYERKGQHAEMDAENVVVDLAAGRLQIGPSREGNMPVDSSDRTGLPGSSGSADLNSSIPAKASSSAEGRTVRLRVSQAGPPILGKRREDLAADLTLALQREIEAKTPLKVVGKNADLELNVTLTGGEKGTLNYNQLYEVREAEVKLWAAVSWRDLRSADKLSRGKQKVPISQDRGTSPRRLPTALARLQAVSQFRPELGESIATALTAALDRLASQAVALMQEDGQLSGEAD